MKKEIKVGIIIAVVEAVFAFVVGYALYLVQEDSLEGKTVATLAGYFNEIDKSMSYEDVMKTLYEGSQEKDKRIEMLEAENQKLMEENQKLKEENRELGALREQMLWEDANKEVINSAQSYADAGDYEMALAILDAVTVKNAQITVLIDDYKKEYEDQLIAHVDSLTAAEKYDEALTAVEEAKEILGDSSLLASKREEIENSSPQLFINTISAYEFTGYTIVDAGQTMQMGGVQYQDGFILGKGYDSAYVYYNLGARYTQISGIIGHIDQSGDSDKTVTIYADGVKLKTIDINYKALPEEVVLDVTGVKQLEFNLSSEKGSMGFAEIMIK